MLHRASRRLAEALPEMDRRQQEQTQCRIESARRELERMAARLGNNRTLMLSQAQRTAILDLSTKAVSKRQIARVLQVSRLTVRKVLRSNSTQVPEIQRPEKAEPFASFDGPRQIDGKQAFPFLETWRGLAD